MYDLFLSMIVVYCLLFIVLVFEFVSRLIMMFLEFNRYRLWLVCLRCLIFLFWVVFLSFLIDLILNGLKNVVNLCFCIMLVVFWKWEKIKVIWILLLCCCFDVENNCFKFRGWVGVGICCFWIFYGN